MTDIRACVIGAGEMGGHHVRTLSTMEDVELVGVADPERDRAEHLVRGRAVPTFAEPLAMVEQLGPDLVVVAVPTSLHADIAVAVLERDAHVLVEKPVADSVEAAARIAAAADAAGKIASIGHIERFNPAIIALREHLAAGQIGRVFQITARRTGPFPARIKDVGVVKDLATHDLDAIRFVTGASFEMVAAHVDRRMAAEQEDLASVLGRLTNGAIAVLDANWLTPTKVRDLRVVGEGGMFVADYIRQTVVLYRNADHRSDLGPFDGFTGVSEGEVVTYEIGRREPLRNELEAVSAAIRTGGAAPVSVGDAIEALVVADKILKAAGTGEVVRVPSVSSLVDLS